MSQKFYPRFSFRCPFCGRQANVGVFICLGECVLPGVVHELPYCDSFDRLDVDRYLEACRKQYEN